MRLPNLILAAALLATAIPHTLATADDAGPATAITSADLEKSLQQLSWRDFKAVISAIPKLKADVDAYGAFGWQYVQANYRSYRWAKKIDKLDAQQKQQLHTLISDTRERKHTP